MGVAIDPDNVKETIAEGRFNLHLQDRGLGTLTFTHARPLAAEMFDNNKLEMRDVVVARIVTTMPNLRALRDLLVQVVKD